MNIKFTLLSGSEKKPMCKQWCGSVGDLYELVLFNSREYFAINCELTKHHNSQLGFLVKLDHIIFMPEMNSMRNLVINGSSILPSIVHKYEKN